MEVPNGNSTRSTVKHTGRPQGGVESKTTMAASQTDSVDKTETRGSPKYRILPKLLSVKCSQNKNNDFGKTGFHVRVSPVATSTPKDKVNGRVVSSQVKRAESRAKRRHYLAGECVSPTSSRTITFPSSPEGNDTETAAKQGQKLMRPCGSPPARPGASPPQRPGGSPPVRPGSSPPTRPCHSSGVCTTSSRPVNGSKDATTNSDVKDRTTIKSDTKDKTKNKSDIKDRTTNKSDTKDKTTNKSDIKDRTTNKSDMKDKTKNKSDIKDRTTNKSDMKDNTTNKSDIKDRTTIESDMKDKTTNMSYTKGTAKNTSKVTDRCDSAVARIRDKRTSSPQTKATIPPKLPSRNSSYRCEPSRPSNSGATPAPSAGCSVSLDGRERVSDATRTYRDEKAAEAGETELIRTPGHRPLVGHVTPTTKTCVQEINANRSKDRNESHARVKSDNETVGMGTGERGASPHSSITDSLVVSATMARTVSHNDALSKSATSGTDADWTGSAPEQLGAGNARSMCATPDMHRTVMQNDNPSDRRWNSTRVVRSRSDVFSCGQSSRPVVSDCVKLSLEGRSSRFSERCRPQAPPPPPPPARASMSADDIDTSRLILLSTRRSFTFSDRHSNLRSSFMQPPPKSPPADPIKNESECGDAKPDFAKSADTEIYSLPQPQCYSEDTMKAIKQITDKYDTLQRRRLQAMSFREAGRRKPSERTLASTSGAESDPAIAESASVPGDRSASTDAVDGIVDDAFGADDDVSLLAGITQRDISRLELFYGSRDTIVAICRCLADVLFSEKSAGNQRSSPAGWRHAHTGIPVFVLNTGRGTRKRDLRVVLAERETGFALWHDKITYLSNYTTHEGATAFHTMQPSSRPIGDLVGLRFYDAAAAEDFHARFVRMTADPTDELWRVGTSGHRKSSTKKRWSLGRKSDAAATKTKTKRDISQPCNFAHVTNVKHLEPGLMSSLADMIARTVARRVIGRSPGSRPSSYSSIASST